MGYGALGIGHWASLLCETLRERLRSGQVGIGHWAQEAPGTPGAEGQRRKNLYNNSPHLPIPPTPPSPYATKHNATDNQKLNKVL